MNIRKIAMAAAVATTAMVGFADPTEYFVSDELGSADYDGLSSNVLSATQGPKKTIQQAVDLANDDDIVTVLPGIYDEGGAVAKETDFRVVISKRIILRSSGGREVTHIVGKRAATQSGLADDSVRGVYMADAPYAIVEGFTIRDCASNKAYRAPDTSKGETWAMVEPLYKGAGVYARWNAYILDCTVSNCAAYACAAAYSGTWARCLIAYNVCEKSAAVGESPSLHNCIVCRNYGGNYLITYPKDIVNCTITENDCTPMFSSGKHVVYNSILVNNEGTVGSATQSQLQDCVTDGAVSQFLWTSNSVCSASVYQLMAPARNDFRPLVGTAGIGRGNATNLTKIALYHSAKVWNDYLSAKYRATDYTGAKIVADGVRFNCGAVQADATAATGPLVITDGTWKGGNIHRYEIAGADGHFWKSYAHAATYPASFALRATYSAGVHTYLYTLEPRGSRDQLAEFPDIAGWVRLPAPPVGAAFTNTTTKADRALYVKANGGSDANDGHDLDHAFKTIQAAVDAAGSGYSIVYADEGVYDQGGKQLTIGDYDYGSNRVVILNKNLSLVSLKGPEKTFIVGGEDKVSGYADGCGPYAVRAVYHATNSRLSSIRGFTITGGRAKFDRSVPGGAIPCERGSAYYGSGETVQDCIISNNYAKYETIENGVFIRCRIFNNGTANNGVVYNARLYASLIYDNVAAAGKFVNAYCTFYGCTIFGSMQGSCNVFGSLCANNGSVTFWSTLPRIAYADGNVTFNSTFAGATCTNTKVSEHVDFVDAANGDYRLVNTSDAIGGAQLAALDAYYAQVPYGLDNEPILAVGGYPTAGCCHRTPQAVNISDPRNGVVVVGGTVGLNAVEPGGNLAVLAYKTLRGRPFLGFTVNGIDLPASQTEYVYTAPSVWSGSSAVEIVANYGKLGTSISIQ